MPNYKMVNADQLDSDLTAIADYLREATGGYDPISFPDGFISTIMDLASGGGGGDDIVYECGWYSPTSDETGIVEVPLSEAMWDLPNVHLVVTLGNGFLFGKGTGELAIYASAYMPRGEDPYNIVTAYEGGGYIASATYSEFHNVTGGHVRIKHEAGKMIAGNDYLWIAAYIPSWG